MTPGVDKEEFFKWQGAYSVVSVSENDISRVKK
jgi:hypothetical protein